MVLQDFNLVAVRVANECGGDGPVVQPLWRRDRFDARVHTALIEALAIVGAQIELPQGAAMLDGPLVIVVPGQLDPVAAFTRQNHPGQIGDLNSMGDLETEQCLV